MAICIFCDSSDSVKLVGGNKGICGKCAEKLAKCLTNIEKEGEEAKPGIEAQIEKLREKCDDVTAVLK